WLEHVLLGVAEVAPGSRHRIDIALVTCRDPPAGLVLLIVRVPDDRIRLQIGERDVPPAAPPGLVADDEVTRGALHRVAVQRAVLDALVLEARHLAPEPLLGLRLALGPARADIGLGPVLGDREAPQVLRARLAQMAPAALLHREHRRAGLARVALPALRVPRRPGRERERPVVDDVTAAAPRLRAHRVVVMVHLDVVLARALVRLEHAGGRLLPRPRHRLVAAQAERARLGELRRLARARLGADGQELGGVALGVEARR